MAQSAKGKIELNLSEQKQTKRSTSTSKMTISKDKMEKMDPDETLEWDVETLNAALKELNVKGGSGWSKSKKAYEVTNAISVLKTKEADASKCSDPNVLMFQLMQ